MSIPVAALILGERASRSEVLITFFAIGSVAIVILGKETAPPQDGSLSSFAIVLMLIAVLALAVGNALLKPIADARALMPLITIQMIIGALVLVLAAASIEGVPHFDPSYESVFALAYLIVIGSIVGMWLWVKLLQQFTAICASAFFLTTPLFGIAVGYLLLDEVLTPVQWFGTAMLCLMILVRSRLGTTAFKENQET